MPGPLYYCPPEVARPAHIKAEAPSRLVEGAGPDRLGGVVYGGILRPEQVWRATSAGWWMFLDGVRSNDLMRLSAIAGTKVPDGEGRPWLVPRLLDGDGAAVGYWTPTGFAVPADLAPLVERLRTLLDYTGKVTAELAQLAADILAVNYHVSLHELAAWQSLTPAVVWFIIGAACGIAPEQMAGRIA